MRAYVSRILATPITTTTIIAHHRRPSDRRKQSNIEFVMSNQISWVNHAVLSVGTRSPGQACKAKGVTGGLSIRLNASFCHACSDGYRHPPQPHPRDGDCCWCDVQCALSPILEVFAKLKGWQPLRSTHSDGVTHHRRAHCPTALLATLKATVLQRIDAV
jgi:hypothetical protein